MIDTWRDEFEHQILYRGRKYFEEGRVRRIQRCADLYTATVEGAADYTVRIDLNDIRPGAMQCDCPYAETYGQCCKHMAALLFALEAGTIDVEELPPAKQPPIVSHIPMEMPWLEAIDKLPEDVVRKELLKRADRDEWLKERLAVLYLGKLPEGQIQNWKADLQEIAAEYTDCTGRIDADGTSELSGRLAYFLSNKLPLLLEVGAVMDAFHLIWLVMETALEWETDDYYDELDDLFTDCKDAYVALLPLASAEQKAQMLQWYREHRDADWPGGVEYMDSVFCAEDAIEAGFSALDN